MRFKAKDPVLNAIAGELAYLIAPIGLDLRAAHSWSERKKSATTSAGCEASGQADLEAYAWLISVATWAKILEHAQGALHIRGDALGVLHPVLKAIAGEWRIWLPRSGLT